MQSTNSTPRIAVLIFLLMTLPAIEQARAADGDIPDVLIRYADLVMFNGQVLTVDAEFSVAEAVAVRDGRILAVGGDDQVLALAGPGTERVDLAGRTVTPGYIYNDGDNAVPGGDIYKDTMVGGWLSGRIDGSEMEVLLSSLDEVLDKAEPAEPVFVNMPKNFPAEAFDWTADDLDMIAPVNPIALFYTSSDVRANNAMLERAFSMGLPQDHFGVIRDENGKPTGALVHEATGFIGWQARPYPSREYIEKGIRDAKASFLGYLSAGVVHVLRRQHVRFPLPVERIRPERAHVRDQALRRGAHALQVLRILVQQAFLLCLRHQVRVFLRRLLLDLLRADERGHLLPAFDADDTALRGLLRLAKTVRCQSDTGVSQMFSRKRENGVENPAESDFRHER